MNPTKRIPNSKNNQAQASPWLLCPSKSFPGKFYYFNGSTGETAWCLSDTDKNVKKGPIHRVTDKSHSYPKPFNPHIDDSTNTTNSFSSVKNTGNNDFTHTKTVPPSPVFGQAVVPRYVHPEMLAPKFVWPWTPMYVQSQMPPHWQTTNQTTQDYEAEQPMLMPPSHMPFRNQFKPLKRPTFMPGTFQYRNSTPVQTFKEAPMFEQTSNINTFKMSQAAQTLGKPLTKDEACQTFAPTLRLKHTQSESDSTTKSVSKSRSVENLSTLFEDVETSTLSPPNEVDNVLKKCELVPKSALKASKSVGNLTSLFSEDVETSSPNSLDKVGNEKEKLMKFGKNDLRFKLVAKRKKVETSTESKKPVKPSDHSNASERRENPAPKKGVTFNLQEPGTGVTSDGVQGPQQSPDSARMEDPSQPISDGTSWYVVADSPVLLTELKHIDELIQSDEHCKLLIPHVVHSELEARGRGDCATVGTASARKLLRRLQSNDSSIIVQSKPDQELSPEDSILECCWDLVQEDCDVILVTNNTNMLNKAKSIAIECYTVEEIKNCDETRPALNMRLAKLKIIVDNDKKESENLFVQDINKINSVSLTKPNILSVYPSRLNIFNSAEENTVIFKRVDNSDKLINLTRPKHKFNIAINSDVSIVKDKIENLSIAETVTVQNRTKQIVNNVWSNPGNNSKVLQNSIDISDRHNLNRSNQNVRKNTNLVIDEMDVDITRFNVKENKRDKSGDAIKVSGITKLKNHFNLDVELQRYCVKSAAMEHRVKIRLDEWSCRLNQVIEGVLTDILLKEGVKMKKMMPPWNLFEAIQVTGETFKNQSNIKTVIDLFSMKLHSCSSNNGKLHKDIKPNEFLKLVGYSMILLEHLKAVVDYTELNEAQNRLGDLLKNMEDPKTDIDLSLEKVNTPIFSRSDISDVHNLIGFRKSPSEILDYLRKHFAAWQRENEQETVDDNINKEPNILVTCGKDLKKLRINNNKNITVENTDQLKVNQPKVIRNVKITEAFEERIKKRAELDLEKLGYEDNENVNEKSNDSVVKSEVPNELYEDVLNDSSVFESIADTVCVQAYPLVKTFLVKLKATLKQIFYFINTSIQEFEVMPMDKKADMLLKAEITRQFLLKMTERLKTIIARESSDGVTLKKLLIKAGDYEKADVAIVNYTATVTKFLKVIQQLEEILAQLLENKTLLLEGKLKRSNATPTRNDSQRSHCNSSTKSPILPTPKRLRKTVQPTNKNRVTDCT